MEKFLLDLTGLTVSNLSGEKIETPEEIQISSYKNVANALYNTVREIDFLEPLQELNKTGKCLMTKEQLSIVDQIVSSQFALSFNVCVKERIANADKI